MGRGQQENGRRSYLPYSLIFHVLLFVSGISAQDSDTLSCDAPITVNGAHYDIQQLAGQHSAKYFEESPPSQYENVITFNICQDIEKSSTLPDSDQCPTGSRACFTKINKKEGENDRIVSVIPIAETSVLKPKYSIINGTYRTTYEISSNDFETVSFAAPEALSIYLHGSTFSVNGKSISPMLNLTLLCNKDGSSDPSFISFENGIAIVEWKTPVGCQASETKEPGNTDPPEPDTGSGIGAYYNYNHFGASGWDLIPHRDFWREVPYLFRDFIDHLCTTLRPGYQGSRRGYVAV
ncbi:hypothetical protein Clacol_000631 [Clathrus columnatus]|uniref:Autophagy-related protein 27 n=1 Tax=Clathrus columnatus TaxID=1419009 RepID=A0AAV4ZZJ0_9AGAM|nr:hypothetical protein Clacol_000631 [Clathrus columnatus]